MVHLPKPEAPSTSSHHAPVFIEADSRDLSTHLGSANIQTTITSPPYFDMKDYGVENQIGFGQKYEQYLLDLTNIFTDIFCRTEPDGSLWIVIDTFRRDGTVIPLPFDLSRELQKIGWNLKDIIIWKKDKTVPWQTKGATRKIFEYVLFFTKSDIFKHYPDRVRDSDNLKEWWVRYPERYNPHGKSLEEVWEFSIPAQGALVKNKNRHFCPLPSGLVNRIIELSTDDGDLVLDPFCGVGTVPLEAAGMGRRGIGLDLNPNYVEICNRRIHEELVSKIQLHSARKDKEYGEFGQTVKDLRILKYARVIFRKLQENGYNPLKILAQRSTKPVRKRFDIDSAIFTILIDETGDEVQISDFLAQLSAKKPLSKYGISSDFLILRDITRIQHLVDGADLHAYTSTNTNQSRKCISSLDNLEDWKIISPIKVDISLNKIRENL